MAANLKTRKDKLRATALIGSRESLRHTPLHRRLQIGLVLHRQQKSWNTTKAKSLMEVYG